MIGDMSGVTGGAVGEGMSDALANYINGDDRVAEYSSNNPIGIRQYPYTNYPRTYSLVVGIHGPHLDGEIYAATLWRLRQLWLGKGWSQDMLLALHRGRDELHHPRSQRTKTCAMGFWSRSRISAGNRPRSSGQLHGVGRLRAVRDRRWGQRRGDLLFWGCVSSALLSRSSSRRMPDGARQHRPGAQHLAADAWHVRAGRRARELLRFRH